jgi:hypothetical protein
MATLGVVPLPPAAPAYRAADPVPHVLALVVGATVQIWLWDSGATARAQENYTLNKADIDRWMTELSNWGRWGKADQVGTVNLITLDKRKAASQLVREGFSVSLARNATK